MSPRPKPTATDRIELRVTSSDKMRLTRLAAKAGLTVSAYLLRCALPTRK